MAGWHHWLDERESQWTPGVGDGQGGLACCDSWGHKESDTTEQLNWTELNWRIYQLFIKIIFGNVSISQFSRSVLSIICTYILVINRTSVWVVMERQELHVWEPWGIREHFSEEVISKVNPKDCIDMQWIWDLSQKFHWERNIDKLQKQNEQLSVNGKYS